MSGLVTGQTPDVTPGQLGALATFIVGQLIAYGVVDKTGQQYAISAVSAGLAIAWKFADAYLRGKRAPALAAAAAPTNTVATRWGDGSNTDVAAISKLIADNNRWLEDNLHAVRPVE